MEEMNQKAVLVADKHQFRQPLLQTVEGLPGGSALVGAVEPSHRFGFCVFCSSASPTHAAKMECIRETAVGFHSESDGCFGSWKKWKVIADNLMLCAQNLSFSRRRG